MELKACPCLIAAAHQRSAYCIREYCAWWCEAAEKCAVAVMGEEAHRRVGEGEKE